jgi:hypothetical protein
MADDGTDLFVKSDSGSVAMIDPDKGVPLSRLTSPADACSRRPTSLTLGQSQSRMKCG